MIYIPIYEWSSAKWVPKLMCPAKRYITWHQLWRRQIVQREPGGSKFPYENDRKNTIIIRIFMNFYHNTQEKSKLWVE